MVKTVLHTICYVYVYGNKVGVICKLDLALSLLVGEGRGKVVFVLLCLYIFQFVYHGGGVSKSQL